MILERLKQKNIIVTGGTQGLGRGIARRLAEEGAAGIAICGRNRENGDTAAEEIRTAGSGRTGCLYIPADLRSEEECRKVVREAVTMFGTLHGLVNAAGITTQGTIEETSIKLWDEIFSVNARAPFILIQETVLHMQKSGIRGSIVNIISDTAHCGQPVLAAYSSSKGALLTLTKNVANSQLRHRIRSNGICIGWTDTPNEHKAQLAAGEPENWLETVERQQPFGRLLKPRDIAALTAYLLSDEAEMMTGAVIDFDQKVIGTNE
jgi:NAD(P)-dependent dehydrogenase (short-subunit alcohol dehydrogenase family)